jgi:hypothetical protein
MAVLPFQEAALAFRQGLPTGAGAGTVWIQLEQISFE